MGFDTGTMIKIEQLDEGMQYAVTFQEILQRICIA